MNAAVRHLWRSVPLKEIVEHSAFGPRFSGELYSESGNIATLRTTDLSPHGQISYESMPLAQIDENQFANHFLRKGDLVISRSGRIGTTAVFEGFELPVLPGAFLIRFRLRETAEPRFYRYFFNSSVGRPLILSVARGAAQQNINISNVERLSVPLPPMREQAAIVSIISSYDDLIENNRRRIALLEKAARMHYREWFVHFRFPGHEHVKIIDGLPEGWRITGVEEAYEGLFDGPHATPSPSDEKHPFRVAIVCAMWLTGFDVECLSTLYIDKPMKAHTLMQAIARANRVFPGKDFGLIVDYNGMLASLRAALAQYALGDDATGGEEIVAPIEERVQALLEALEATEAHLRGLGFDPLTLIGAKGFTRIKGLADAVEAVYSTDEAKRRFEILARQVFIRFKALLMEPTVYIYAERHDNIEAIYKKLTERRDTADVTELLKELHRIVNEAIWTQVVGDDQAEGLTFDLSQIDLERLRDEFAKKVRRKATALQDIRDVVEQKLAEMLARNPARMDYQRKYEDIVADYNREKDRTTIEETFRRLIELVNSLDLEQKRAAREGLSEDELALFDVLQKEGLDKAARERVKQASKELLASVKARLDQLDRFWEKEQTKAEIEVFILDELFARLPTPPFTATEKETLAGDVYRYVWQRAVSADVSLFT